MKRAKRLFERTGFKVLEFPVDFKTNAQNLNLFIMQFVLFQMLIV